MCSSAAPADGQRSTVVAPCCDQYIGGGEGLVSKNLLVGGKQQARTGFANSVRIAAMSTQPVVTITEQPLHEFHWTETAEPHSARRKELLQKYGPQIRALYGHDARTAYQVGFVLCMWAGRPCLWLIARCQGVGGRRVTQARVGRADRALVMGAAFQSRSSVASLQMFVIDPVRSSAARL